MLFLQYSNTPLLHRSNVWSFLLVPFQDHAVHDPADLEQLFFVVHHFRTSEPGDGVILAQKDGLLGANFFAHPAKNAANHVDIELAWILLDFAEAIFRRNFARLYFDGARRTDEFAQLTGDAADTPSFVLHQGWRAAIMFRQLRVPFLFGVLHRHLGPAEEHIFEMPERDRHSRRDRWQIQSLGPSKFRSWNGDSHCQNVECRMTNDERMTKDGGPMESR